MMTYEVAMAAGREAANRQMASEGRTVWTRADYALAADIAERLMTRRGVEDDLTTTEIWTGTGVNTGWTR